MESVSLGTSIETHHEYLRTPAPAQDRHQFDEDFNKLKAEADAKYGTGKRMSVGDYFDKLWYIVEGLYENVDSPDTLLSRFATAPLT